MSTCMPRETILGLGRLCTSYTDRLTRSRRHYRDFVWMCVRLNAVWLRPLSFA